MKVSEIKTLFKEIFEDEKGLVKTVDTVYEKSKDEDFLKLVISIHDLQVQDTLIIHTKFIFKTDLEKNNLIGDSFIYLYDINCVYRTVEFKDAFDLEKKIKNIVNSNKFGKDIQTLSEFIDTPGLLLSHYFTENNIQNFSIGYVNYDPKFKTRPCEETTFDFDINVVNDNNDYNFNLTISKQKDVDSKIFYRFIFKLLDKTETVDVDKLLNIHFLIGHQIVDMLNSILK
jgi:hypothetical protein